MMTKKHFESVAKSINIQTTAQGWSVHKEGLVQRLADFFETENPNFDRDRFYKVCYEDNPSGRKH